MTAPSMPQLENTVSALASDLQATPPSDASLWAVQGPATAGKTATLGHLAGVLRGQGLHPILVSPPAGALDSGLMALAEIAAGLKDAGTVNGETEILKDGSVPLAAKVEKVRGWITAANDSVVLLLDDPLAWPSISDPTRHFTEHAETVVDELVRGLACRRVLTGDAPQSIRPLKRFRLSRESEPRSFLMDEASWGSLAAAAAELWEVAGDRLSGQSPLGLRLLVAYTTIDSVAGAIQVSNEAGRNRWGLSEALRIRLNADQEYRPLLRSWEYLAHVRRSFDETLVQLAAGGLDEPSRSLLKHCLLYPTSDGQFILHDTLRRDVLGDESDSQGAQETLRDLTIYYRQQRDSAEKAHQGRAFPDAIDVFHYAAEVGDESLLDEDPYFVDQLNILGKNISYHQHRFEDAARVFERAVKLDDSDDYAHHYLAYNLDRVAQEPVRVEEHYRRAIELNEAHPWWRARLVQFLIVRGRTRDATDEWHRALDELPYANGSDDPDFYAHLHGWVLDTALRRGLLDFADRIVRQIPATVRHNERLSGLIHRLRALQIAERDGAYVPADRLKENWWLAGPALLAPRLGDDDPMVLRRWLAGRMETITEAGVELRISDIKIGDEQRPRRASLMLSPSDFNRLSRDGDLGDFFEGQFIEFGIYSTVDGGETRQLLRVHPIDEDDFDGVPSALRTDRYLSGYMAE